MNTKSQLKDGSRIQVCLNKWFLGRSAHKKTKYIRLVFDENIVWTGWLTPKAKEHTLKTLRLLGFKGDDPEKAAMPGALDTQEIVIATIRSGKKSGDKYWYDASFINKLDDLCA